MIKVDTLDPSTPLASQFQQQTGRRSTIVRAHELPAWEQLGIVMSRDDHGLSTFTGKLSDDVLHGDGALGSLRGECVFSNLALARLELSEDVSLQLVIRLGARGARSEGHGVARELQCGHTGDTGGGNERGE